MKSVVLGIFGFFIAVYTIFIGLDIYSIQTRKLEWNLKLSRTIKNVLREYEAGEETMGIQQLREELLENGNENQAKIFIQKIDLEKGILSVKVSETMKLLTREEKEIQLEKTGILEKIIIENPFLE